MTDLLTIFEQHRAAAQGWQVCHVHDAATARWIVEVLPTNHPAASAADAQALVYRLARTGDTVAIRALQLIVNSHRFTAPPKRKKK